MARPKTVAIIREIAIGYGETAIKRLVHLIEHADIEDPRMAAVVERACEALLDRIGLVPPKPPDTVEPPEDKKPIGKEASTEELLAAESEGEA